MGFYNKLKKIDREINQSKLVKITAEDVENVLKKEVLTEEDFLVLLSKEAGNRLEAMAQRARDEHLKHFGKAVVMYTPMYVSNYCMNNCSYCGFNVNNKIKRSKLTLEEVELEAQKIAESGLKHILMLTGESNKATPMSYLKSSLTLLKKYFQSIAIEIFPLEKEEYVELIGIGVDGLAIYQETYNETIYDTVHISGPKKDFEFRLDAPERGCSSGMRQVSIGALLGLDDWRHEVYSLGLHGKYLVDKYPHVEYSFSFPRIKPCEGEVSSFQGITDQEFVQIITALKIFLPYYGTNISTREDYNFRKNMLNIGISKMSAGVSTSVGGHTKDHEKSTSQFEISDHSSVEAVEKMICDAGYQPVYKDWLHI